MGSSFLITLSEKTQSAVATSIVNSSIAICFVANAAEDAAETITKTASDAAETVVHGAGTTAGAVVRGASTAAGFVADKAEIAADAIATKGGEVAAVVKEHSLESHVKRAKVSAFRDGIHEGASLMVDKVYGYSLALAAMTMYVARCDGDVADEEIVQLESSLKHLYADENVPKVIRDELNSLINNEALAFEEVEAYFDKLSVATLESLRVELDETIAADNRIAPEEKAVRQQFDEYVAKRRDSEAGEDG